MALARNRLAADHGANGRLHPFADLSVAGYWQGCDSD